MLLYGSVSSVSEIASGFGETVVGFGLGDGGTNAGFGGFDDKQEEDEGGGYDDA